MVTFFGAGFVRMGLGLCQYKKMGGHNMGQFGEGSIKLIEIHNQATAVGFNLSVPLKP